MRMRPMPTPTPAPPGDLAAAYGGTVTLGDADLGGLRVVLTLPAVPAPTDPRGRVSPP